MPSASTAICVQCEVQPSKYTCPACRARTCSLACTKAHKAAETGGCSSSAVAKSPNGVSTSASSSPAPTAGSSAKASQGLGYVPLTQYTESHMMQDFLFLSSISRTTAENGRKILSMNLLPPASGTDTQHKHTASPNQAASTTRLTNQQRQREQLIKQLHYRRFKVMVLPDGMARRKTNQSQFQPKDKKFVLTVELAFPHRKTVLHRQDSSHTVEQVVLNELQHQSFPNKKDLQRLKAGMPSGSTTIAKGWIISKSVLEHTRLPLPAAATPLSGEGEFLALSAFPREWIVLVPAYSARLTNESTTRYLDWWTRKRRWEEANPALALQQKQEEQEGQRQGDGWNGKRARGGWGDKGGSRAEEVEKEPQQGEEKMESPAVTASAPQVVEPAVGGSSSHGIISSTLLSMLSQRLGRQPTFLESATQPASLPSTSAQPASPTPPIATTSSHTAPPISSDNDATSILLSLTHPHRTTLSWLLQTIPEGYSVVEYPELRIVPAEAAAEAGVKVVPLTGEGAGVDEAEAPHSDGAGEKGVGEVKGDGSTTAGARTAAAVTSGSLGGLLAGYDSESSDDDGEDDQVPEKDPPKRAVEHADPSGAQAALDEAPARAGGSLASLAFQHGFLHAPPSSNP
ncbi:hypothetical protein EX895_004611 [Sporisorium graminicola]|uniref:HIT-type domain-containing protein n=1 Tax=Sporisorium graminicola TaxID=280036 RepID=A0A4U7KU10_9BASI|nr:hypothetical protein EX895_004611 [Sporisorium graminicola]TKY86462.1 hypothetical protein EX895_004611 [Sporisorium graminicola]